MVEPAADAAGILDGYQRWCGRPDQEWGLNDGAQSGGAVRASDRGRGRGLACAVGICLPGPGKRSFSELSAYALAVPLLRQAGYTVDQIGSTVAFVLLPMTLYFLWSPVVDMGLRRRTWIVLLASLSGVLLAGGIVLLGQHVRLASWLLFAGYGVSLMTNSAAGGLLSLTQRGDAKARAGAWMQGGGLAATALGGAALLYAAKHCALWVTGLIAACMVVIPALMALTIPEPAPWKAQRSVRRQAADMAKEIREALFSWRSLPGVLLLVAPVGTGAAQSLFVAMAPDYHVGMKGVLLLNGLLGGIVTMAGALAAAMLPPHWDRRKAYVVAGALCGGVGLLLTIAPPSPAVYFVGVTAYLLTVGICYAYFLGVVLQTMGEAKGTASTRFTILVSLGNLPIVYMTRVEAWGSTHLGLRGVPALDAAGICWWRPRLGCACLGVR